MSQTHLATPPRRNYHRFQSDTSKSWSSPVAGDEEENDGLGFDAEEDEFGLPSLVSARRFKKSDIAGQPSSQLLDTVVDSSNETPLWRVNSGDIAEERGLPNYPTARQGDGKILRPQYKDILRGWFDNSFVKG